MRFYSGLLVALLLTIQPVVAQDVPVRGPALPPQTAAPRGAVPGGVGGIAVTGRATIRVPADGLRIQAYVFGDVNKNVEDAIVARLRRGGLESAQVLPPAFFSNPNNNPTIVRAVLRHATPEKVDALVKLAASILAEQPGLRLQNGSLSPFLDDCSASDSKTRHAALDDAHRRALDVAQAVGVTLGPVIGVNDLGGSTCAAFSELQFGNGGGNGLETEPAVYVSTTVNVTYAIVR